MNPSLYTLRLIIIAMIAGSCVVGGTVIFSASRIGAKAFADPVIGSVMAGIAITALLAQTFLVPRLFARKRRETADNIELLNLFATETLTRAGMLVGASLLLDVVYLFTLDDKILVAGATLIASLLLLIPTENRFAQWQRNAT